MRKKLVYLMSLRNAIADCAGQWVDFKGEKRYMKSPLEYLVEQLNQSQLGNLFSLEAVIYDDDGGNVRDQEKNQGYSLSRQGEDKWIYPADLCVQGGMINDLIENIPSTYRRLSINDSRRKEAKKDFEQCLQRRLQTIGADWVVVDGLILILGDLVKSESPFYKKMINIHPGITQEHSPFVRRGATATLDALYGARGERIVNWQTMEVQTAERILKTGASFHYMDQGIDSGPVFWEVLNTDIEPTDTILELRWKNFNNSLFPALSHGLAYLGGLP